MDTSRLFPGMDAEEIANIERATGLRIADEKDWSSDDYDSIIAYFRCKALAPPTFILRPKPE